MTGFSEADWELVALDNLGEHEWQTLTGTQIAPGADDGRESWDDIVLPDRMLAKMRELNPNVPGEYLDQARAAIIQPQSQDAIAENFRLHQILVHGYRGISYIDSEPRNVRLTRRGFLSRRCPSSALPGLRLHRRCCATAEGGVDRRRQESGTGEEDRYLSPGTGAMDRSRVATGGAPLEPGPRRHYGARTVPGARGAGQ